VEIKYKRGVEQRYRECRKKRIKQKQKSQWKATPAE
jgi:hypothetical protein